ncbi:MAG: BatD family protein [bacterium]
MASGRGLRRVLAALAGAVLISAFTAGAATAEDLRVEASVDTKNVTVGETLTLTLTAYGDGKIVPPDLTSLDGFEVVSSYTSQNISIVNARMSRSVSIQYVLVALREGDLALGPFTVRSDKAAYQTEPIAVRVTKGEPGASRGPAPQGGGSRAGAGGTGAARPGPDSGSGGRDILASAAVDKKRAYVGEQITYALTFAYRVEVNDAAFDPPDHAGFWSEEIGQTSSPTVKVIDGVKYYTITKTTAFFPISSGRYTIGAAGVRYIAQDRAAFSRDPFSFFRGDPFGRTEGTAKADPISIEVLPLPSEGRPSDFSGAVGSFSLSVAPSAEVVKVGESVTLSVRVHGQGNIKSIGEIPLPRCDGFRVFAPKARDSVRVEAGRIGGAKIFELVLVPERVGTLSVGGLSLVYFDPAKGAYVRKEAGPIEITVLEGDESTMRALAASGERPTLRQDIRHIRRPPRIGDDLSVVPAGGTGVVVRLAPVFIGLAGVVVAVRRKRMAASGRTRVRKVSRALARDLGSAHAVLAREGAVAASATVSRAIRAYIAQRKGTSESLVDAACLLSMPEVCEESRSRVAQLLAALDQVRFAPAGSADAGMKHLIDEAAAAMRKLDEEWQG